MTVPLLRVKPPSIAHWGGGGKTRRGKGEERIVLMGGMVKEDYRSYERKDSIQ